MSNVQKYIGLGLAMAIGIGNGVYTFGPSLKEESERRKGEVLGGTLRPQESAYQQQQPTATAKDKQEASKA